MDLPVLFLGVSACTGNSQNVLLWVLPVLSCFIVHVFGLFNAINGQVTMDFKDPLILMETLMHERPWKLRLVKFVLLQRLLCWTIISTNNWRKVSDPTCSFPALSIYDLISPVFSMRSVYDDKGFKFDCHFIILFVLYVLSFSIYYNDSIRYFSEVTGSSVMSFSYCKSLLALV